MGSAHLIERPDIMEEKKTIKNILSKPLKSLNRLLFSKKKENNIKHAANSNCNEANLAQTQEKQKKVDVDVLVENLYKFKIKEREKGEELNKEEDELNKFVFKVIEDDRKSERTSQSSEDSGFADKFSDTPDDDKSDITFDETLSLNNKPQVKNTQKDTPEKREENGVKIEEALQNLKISEDGKKAKRLQTFSLARTPIRNNNKAHLTSSHPYGVQINQIHKHSFCGGNVIFNEDPIKLLAEHEPRHYNNVDNNVANIDQINYIEKPSIDNFTELDEALHHAKENAQNVDVNTDELNNKLDDIMDFIINDSIHNELNNDGYQFASETCNDRLSYLSVAQNNDDQIKNTSYEQSISEVNKKVFVQSSTEIVYDVFVPSSNAPFNDVNQIDNRILQDFAITATNNTPDPSYGITSFSPNEVTNSIEEFARLENGEYTNITSLVRDSTPLDLPEETFSEGSNFPEGTSFVRNFQDYDFKGPFLTPPHSDNMMPSPSDSVSFYPSLTSVSPAHSLDLENERFGALSPPELPSFLNESPEKSVEKSEKKRERKSSSSMTMKQYKDLQKELSAQFTSKDCCDPKRPKCNDLFMEYVNKLSIEQRKNLCVAVARLELMEAYSYLHRILLFLSESSDKEEWHYALFFLICQRVIGQSDKTAQKIFVGDYGLRLLKSAALRCTHRSLLTRLLAECARKVVHDLGTQITEPIFQEIDSQGDNLIIVCVRKGDAAAEVLYELLYEPGTLFDVDHSNTEGLTALHEACRQHSAATPALHVAHVLLTHGHADLWKGDVTGEDTAVHLAVNSAHCDLALIMIMFRHVDRKQWRKLAHLTNRSSKTPLEYARTAVKSADRKNYPVEVLEFLKKCR